MNTTATQRFHSLDNLRALMMWLGIVLHVCVNHLTAGSPLPWHDPKATPVADVLLLFIHVFRMPVFFILAGFFAALLVQRRGAAGMLRNRTLRLAVPFVLFWPPLFAGMALLSQAFVRRSGGVVPASGSGIAALDNTMHLWFLYLLFWFCVAAALAVRLARHAPPALRTAPGRAMVWLAARPWGFIVLALPLALVGAQQPMGLVDASNRFLPHAAEWFCNGVFFVFGFVLHGRHAPLFAQWARHSGRHAAAGLVCFVAALLLLGALAHGRPLVVQSQWWIALAWNCAAWLGCFALIGLAVRHLATPNPVLRYLAQSAYWVYLVHMLGTIGFGAMLCNAPFGALEKMGLNIAATTLACLASYQLLVRHTPLGRLLNGRPEVSRSAAPVLTDAP